MNSNYSLKQICEIEFGPIKVNKEMHTPSIERFTKFYNIINKKEWFDLYNYWVVGGFTNVLRNKQKWLTWDVDMILVKEDDSNLQEIKNVLIELSEIAIIECGFYLDVYFVKSEKNNTPISYKKIKDKNSFEDLYILYENPLAPGFDWSSILENQLQKGLLVHLLYHPHVVLCSLS